MSSSRAKVFASDTKPSAISGMKPLNIECALGHDTGISGSSYYRPTDQQLLDDYLLAIDSLTVNDVRRQSQVEQLTKREEEMKTMTYIHDLEIKELKDQVKQDVKKAIGDALCKIKAGNCERGTFITARLFFGRRISLLTLK